MPQLLHFEDFPAGEVTAFGAYEIGAEEIKDFAAEFDPQPFHLSEFAGELSIAGGLSSSGWHTLAIAQRLMVIEGDLKNTASLGSPGVEEVKWLKPVFPGDVLTCRRTTIDARVSKTRPGMGIITFRWELLDQNGQLKLDMKGTGLVKVRGAAK